MPFLRYSPPRSRTETTERIRLDERWRHGEQVRHQALEEEAVVLDLAGGVYFGLDPVGTRIWELLDGRKLIDIRDAILGEFEVDAATATRDLLRLVTELEREGLIRLLDADDPTADRGC